MGSVASKFIEEQHVWAFRLDRQIARHSRSYMGHETIVVVASTMESALAAAREAYPEGKVWAVNHAGGNRVLLSSEAIASLVAGDEKGGG